MHVTSKPKSKHLLPISNNKVSVKVSVIFAAVYPYLKSSIFGTIRVVNCSYSETRVMLKLARRARGHVVTLIEVRLHHVGHLRVDGCLLFETSLSAKFL